jgi:metal-responsive CopG/Arc/MetJ family transcriptional regulator
MKEKKWQTISTKIDTDLIIEFENVLGRMNQTKSDVLRVAVLEYIKQFSDNSRMKDFADAIQFMPKDR